MICQPVVSTMAVALLCSQDNPTKPVHAPRLPTQLRKGKPVALVIDDERLIADTICRILNKSGFEAFPAYSGTAALERASQCCPDIVISDVIMPDIDGIATATSLLEKCPSVQIVLLSGLAAGAQMMERAQLEGFRFHMLAKPVHPDDLLATLHGLGF
jgi:DNA-binding response OmpR family regulator